MGKTQVAVTVLVPVAALIAVWLWRVAAMPRLSWRRQELRHAAVGAILVVPAAVVFGAVNGVGTGIMGLLLWGILGAVCFGAARIDAEEDLDSDTRWLIDIASLAFVAVTVFFTVVGFGYVFLPSAAFLLVAWRLAHLRRTRALRRG